MRSVVNVMSDKTNIDIGGKVDVLAQFNRDEKNELLSYLKVSPSDIMIDKLALNLFPAEVWNKGERTEVHNLGIGVNKKKYIGLNGVISKELGDSLNIDFNHAEIG